MRLGRESTLLAKSVGAGIYYGAGVSFKTEKFSAYCVVHGALKC